MHRLAPASPHTAWGCRERPT